MISRHLVHIHNLLLLTRLLDNDVFQSIYIVVQRRPTVLVKALQMRSTVYVATLIGIVQALASCSTFLTPLAYLFHFEVFGLGRQRVPAAVHHVPHLGRGVHLRRQATPAMVLRLLIIFADRNAEAEEAAVFTFRFGCFSMVLRDQVLEAVLRGLLAAERRDQSITHFRSLASPHFPHLQLEWIGVDCVLAPIHTLVYLVSFLRSHFIELISLLAVFVATKCGLEVEPKLQIPEIPFFLFILQILSKYLVVNPLCNFLKQFVLCYLFVFYFFTIGFTLFDNLKVEQFL